MPKIVRAIVIDPTERSIQYRDLADDLRAFHEALDTDMIDWCYPFTAPARVCLWCAEFGALQNPPWPAFRILGYRWPIYGKALLIGFGAAGETRDIRLTVEDLYTQIDFE